MSAKIFVLDDDENACQLAEQVLEKDGYEVKTQTRGIGATAAIRLYKPDLVLLDVMMPAISGGNLAEIIMNTLKPTPKIIFHSNKSADDLRQIVDDTGVDGFVCKTDGPTALINAVRDVLDRD